ncbi:MAG: hypothetical protein CM15mP46_3360 [Alphaproteobacteria bacterium]|nr:MAG: hypothetical protein CM15mP46_3360 [Alphaproteobacteria bacterium]
MEIVLDKEFYMMMVNASRWTIARLDRPGWQGGFRACRQGKPPRGVKFNA